MMLFQPKNCQTFFKNNRFSEITIQPYSRYFNETLGKATEITIKNLKDQASLFSMRFKNCKIDDEQAIALTNYQLSLYFENCQMSVESYKVINDAKAEWTDLSFVNCDYTTNFNEIALEKKMLEPITLEELKAIVLEVNTAIHDSFQRLNFLKKFNNMLLTPDEINDLFSK